MKTAHHDLNYGGIKEDRSLKADYKQTSLWRWFELSDLILIIVR